MDAYRNFSREGLGSEDMASAEREPIVGSGGAPSGVQAREAKPLVSGSGCN